MSIAIEPTESVSCMIFIALLKWPLKGWQIDQIQLFNDLQTTKIISLSINGTNITNIVPCWIYLYEAEHPVMDGSGGVVPGQYGPDQNSFNKVLWRHQNVEAVAAVLDARFKNLSERSNTLSQLRHFTHVYVLHTQHPLTVRDNMISWKFLFPTILFFRALTESLGLQIKAMLIRGPVFKK